MEPSAPVWFFNVSTGWAELHFPEFSFLYVFQLQWATRDSLVWDLKGKNGHHSLFLLLLIASVHFYSPPGLPCWSAAAPSSPGSSPTPKPVTNFSCRTPMWSRPETVRTDTVFSSPLWVSDCAYRSQFILSLLHLNFFFNVYLFLKEREPMCKLGRYRGRGRQRIWIHKPWDHDLSPSQMLNRLSHPGAPLSCTLNSPSIGAPGWLSQLSVNSWFQLTAQNFLEISCLPCFLCTNPLSK